MNLTTKILLIIITILSVVCGWYIYRSDKFKKDYIIYKNNYEVSKDSLHVYKLKNNDLLYSNGSYILNIKELEETIDIKESYIKNIERELDNKVIYISKIETQLSIKDSLLSNQPIIRDTIHNTLSSVFNFKNDWYVVQGDINIKEDEVESRLNNINMNVPLKVGLTEDWKIFVNSENPYIDINNIQGAILDPTKYVEKKKRVQIGLQAGYYIIYNKGFEVGPGVGIGLNVNIW